MSDCTPRERRGLSPAECESLRLESPEYMGHPDVTVERIYRKLDTVSTDALLSTLRERGFEMRYGGRW